MKEDRKIYTIYRDNVNYLKLLLTEDDRVDAAVDGNNIGTPRGGHYGEVRPKLDKGALSNFLFRKKIFNYLMREQLIPIDAINADGHKPLFLSLKNVDQYFYDKTSGEGCRSQHFGSSKRDSHWSVLAEFRKTSKKLIENDADLNRQNEEIFNLYVYDENKSYFI